MTAAGSRHGGAGAHVFHPASQAWVHALRKAPIAAAAIAAVVTGAHFVRVHRTHRITAASLRSVHRVPFGPAEAAEHGGHAPGSIRSLPAYGG